PPLDNHLLAGHRDRQRLLLGGHLLADAHLALLDGPLAGLQLLLTHLHRALPGGGRGADGLRLAAGAVVSAVPAQDGPRPGGPADARPLGRVRPPLRRLRLALLLRVAGDHADLVLAEAGVAQLADRRLGAGLLLENPDHRLRLARSPGRRHLVLLAGFVCHAPDAEGPPRSRGTALRRRKKPRLCSAKDVPQAPIFFRASAAALRTFSLASLA